MYIKLLLRLILGYVRVEIEGYYVERFVNICTNKKMLFWNLKRVNGVKLFLNIGVFDFKKLCKISKKTNCKVKILNKRGIPFILNKYRKRKIFVIFLMVIIVLIYISSMYIWNIQIVVEDNLILDNIESDLDELGLKRGVLKSKINTGYIINELRLRRNDIAWVGIDLKGTNIIVDIVKADVSPNVLDNSDYCNIIATKPGIITKIIAQNGTSKVSVGDSVQKGDVLIAGYMEGKYTDIRYVHSLGIVEAKVIYQDTETIKLDNDFYYETGNKEVKYEILFNNFNLKLYKNISKYENYTSCKLSKNIRLLGDYYLPITITKIENKEQQKGNKKYTVNEAVEQGIKDLSEKLEKIIPDKLDIIDKSIKTEEGENEVTVTVVYEVNEEITEYQKIQ